MNNTQLKKLYNLQEEISRVERTIFNKEFYEGNGFIHFEALRDIFNDVYKEFDDKKYSYLTKLTNIVYNKYKTFDFNKLTKEEEEELTSKEGVLSLLYSDEKNYPHCIVKFNDIDEVIDYVLNN